MAIRYLRHLNYFLETISYFAYLFVTSSPKKSDARNEANDTARMFVFFFCFTFFFFFRKKKLWAHEEEEKKLIEMLPILTFFYGGIRTHSMRVCTCFTKQKKISSG